MKKNGKIILGLLISFIIGISTTVTAATVFNSKDITYSSDKTTKTNVKDSLDELYKKAGKCPEGKWCYDIPMTLADKVELGDYISMTPTSTNYTISKDLTGYDKDQTINPSELNLWRVIKKNEDGTIDVVSHYWSFKTILLYGETGYLNLVKILNEIAAQYTNEKYVSKTRHMGYSNQTESCKSLATCPVDTGYETDFNLVKAINALKEANENKVMNLAGATAPIWLPSRVGLDGKGYNTFLLRPDGILYVSVPLINTSGKQGGADRAVRPVLTLKSYITIKSGDGKSKDSAYQLD